jgi:hypothetical protein
MSRLCLSVLSAAGLLALCGLLHPALVQANPLLGLSDPTRPPAGLVRSDRAGGSGASGGVAAAPEAASAASVPPAPPREPELVLHLVRTDPVRSRGVALINDRLLEIGSRIEGWTLVAVNSNEAFLQGPRGRLRLSLTGTQVIERNPKSAQSRRGRKE